MEVISCEEKYFDQLQGLFNEEFVLQKETVLKRMADEKILIKICVSEEDEIGGIYVGQVLPQLNEERDFLYLQYFIIKDEFKNRKVGQLMIADLKQEIEKRNLSYAFVVLDESLEEYKGAFERMGAQNYITGERVFYFLNENDLKPSEKE